MAKPRPPRERTGRALPPRPALTSDEQIAVTKYLAYYAALFLARVCDSHFPELRPGLDPLIARLAPARHSEDFTCVRWFGQTYWFSLIRARLIRTLWEHWLAGVPKVSSRHLVGKAGASSSKASDLLKDEPACGEGRMISTDGDGRYWLQPPLDQVHVTVGRVVRALNKILSSAGLGRFAYFQAPVTLQKSTVDRPPSPGLL